jgi:signal transduction histidine kinase
MLGICVQDQGVGIPAEHLGRIFDRFHRVDMRLTREVDGLGLGLAICQRIVELHGGAIWAESAPGAGSTVHVLLPLEAAEATETRASDDPRMPGAQGVPPAPGAPVEEEI